MIIFELASLGAGGLVLNGFQAQMNLGFRVASAGDVNGDGIADFLVAQNYEGSGATPGGIYVLFGKIGGLGPIELSALDPEDGFFIQEEPGVTRTGESLAAAGDVNGDGFDDILIGAARFGSYAGRAYVIFGRQDGFGTVALDALGPDDGFIVTNATTFQSAGAHLASAGDVNQDGYDDFIVTTAVNRAYVLFGGGDGFGTIELTEIDSADGFVIEGADDNVVAGVVAPIGDFNGDGIDDFLISSFNSRAYVLFGKTTGFDDLDLTGFAAGDGIIVQESAPFENLGAQVASAGDFNGDGLADIIVTKSNAKAYLVFGRSDGTPAIDVDNLGAGGFLIQGRQMDGFAGKVAFAGDVNGDGFDDVLISAHADGAYNHGGAYVIFGKASAFATIHTDTFADSDGFFIRGVAQNDYAGRAIASAGDVNGDGFDDILIGAYQTDAGGMSNAGTAYLVYGMAPTDAVTRIGAAADQTIRGGVGDDMLDGVGGNDSLFGAGGADTLEGGIGNDLLDGGAGDDDLDGGEGDDVLDGGLGADLMAGGLGNDSFLVDDAGDTIVEGVDEGLDEVRSDLASISIAAFANVENLTGGAGDQSLTGNGHNNRIDGAAGADAMAGGGGNDTYIVDNLGDTVTELDGAGVDEVRTGLGSKAPPDRLVYVLPDFVENLTGTSAGAQGVRDNALDNVITMGGGHDLVVADAGGVDTVNGGGGNDFIYHGDKLTAADVTNGGAGSDTIGLLGDYGSGITFTAANLVGVERMALYTSLYLPGTGPNNYNIVMNDANVAAGTEFFVTAASLQSNESLIFNGAAETNGRFTIHGGGGADTIIGGAGGDFVIGNGGNDTLYGLGGQDFLIGGLGADQLRGGAGSDRFVYQSAAQSAAGSIDQILDFQHVDRIDLSAIDANGNGGDGNSAFAFIGSNAFGNVAGELRAYQNGGGWFVEGDTNGDGLADLVIQVTLPDATPLGAGDFIL